ncbi:DUF2625 family protein [Mollicutes bacterium LVI A0078]|nr:DUF2625 family protein [Mollicutes bacterium LVI A0075]WOO91699.1 DUF2625 family protein [Mollicutes bacterium LVI A0078]
MKVKKLEVNEKEQKKIYEVLELTEKSNIGQFYANYGGLVVQNVIRVHGSALSEIEMDLLNVNEGNLQRGFLEIANDIFGGAYILNSGAFEEGYGMVFYLNPETLSYENLEVDFGQFINYICTNDILSEWYVDIYNNKLVDTEILPTQGVSVYPFFFTKEFNLDTADYQVIDFQQLRGSMKENAFSLFGENIF